MKQDVERKEEQIKALKAKVETLMQELDTSRAVMDSRSKTEFTEMEKEQQKIGKTKQALRATEGKVQKLSVMLRTMFRELLTDIEKLRARAGAYQKGMAKTGEIDNKFYMESLNILGIGAEEMGEFVQPKEGAALSAQENADLVKLVEQINRVVEGDEMPRDYEDIIEQHKGLLKERTELEKLINMVEEKPMGMKGVKMQSMQESPAEKREKMKTMGES